MLEITPQARVELREMLEMALTQQGASGDGAELSFRLIAARTDDGQAQMGLMVDSVREGDAVFDHDGRSILLIDHAAARLVGHLILDILDTDEGKRLELRQGS